MSEFLAAVASWPSFLLAVVLFGFLPGFCLRGLVKIYPKNDPRRKALIGDLYDVPRLLRPFWVAEQLETVLYEGLPARVTSSVRWLIGVMTAVVISQSISRNGGSSAIADQRTRMSTEPDASEVIDLFVDADPEPNEWYS